MNCGFLPLSAIRNPQSAIATFVLSVSLVPSLCAAASINLGWNDSASANVTGYKIHYGTAPRAYTQHLDVGKVNTATISNLTTGTLYFFAATAYNATGIEGPYSNEVRSDSPTPTPSPSATATPTPSPSFTVTVIPSEGIIAHLGDRVSYTVKLTGTGFIGPVTLSASGLPAGVTATFVSNPILSKTTMKLVIDDCLPRGSYPFTVKGQSGQLTKSTAATLLKQ